MIDLLSMFRRTIQPHGDHDGSTADESAPLVTADGWLTGVQRFATRRTQALATPTGRVEGIVWHWTSTAGGGQSMARRAIALPRPGQHVGSWHLLIERDGTIYQSAPLTVGTWHAGGKTAARFSRSEGQWEIDPGGRCSANAWACGVELVCVGEVRSIDREWQGWPYGRDGQRGPVVDDLEVEAVGGRHYQRYSPAQIRSARQVVAAVREYCGALSDRSMSWGHRDIDPDRKTDPGPIWDRILPQVLA